MTSSEGQNFGGSSSQARHNGHLYPISLNPSSPLALASIPSPGPVWHRRLGHCGETVLRLLRSRKLISSSSNFEHDCISCHLGKPQRLPFSDASHTSSAPLQLIHFDVWKSPVLSNLGFKYYVCFIDDFSRFTWVYPLRTKNEVIHQFRVFKDLVENLFHSKI
ncbi:unnamed protein product, partial [Cuscuta europaea]